MAKKIHSYESRKNRLRRYLPVIVILVLSLSVSFGLYYFLDLHLGEENTGSNGRQIRTIVVDGQEYTLNEENRTYLFAGLDSDDPTVPAQADVLLLVSVNDRDENWQIIEIPRDSMVDVPVLDLYGNAVSTEFGQIALAHTYSEDPRLNAINTADAVKELFQIDRVDGYYTLTMEGLSQLTDDLGGVEVEITSDFSQVDPTLVQGERMLLNGDQALTYIRSRKDVDDQTNLSRMNRQQEFVGELGSKVKGLGETRILELYDSIFPYTETNIGSGQAVELVETLTDYEQLPTIRLAGEMKVEEGIWAYYLDTDDLNHVIAKVFYTPGNE